MESTGGLVVGNGDENVAGEVATTAEKFGYIFRGDDHYLGGPAGRAFGEEADSADIQNFADHVLRKESNLSSRYLSFSEEVRIARRFTSGSDNRYVRKTSLVALRQLEEKGVIRIWDPTQVYEALRAGPKKLAKQAADVQAAMKRNREVLIKGQIPGGILEQTY
jgi:hypothetical protein